MVALVFTERESLTTIIIAQRKEKLEIAWDSQSTAGNRISHTQKLASRNDQILIAVTGYTRYSNVLSYTDVPAAHPGDFDSPDFDIPGYLITRVVPAWIDQLRESFHTVPDSKEDWPNGVAVVIVKDRVFEIGYDFSVTEIKEEFYGWGSGGSFARGALEAGSGTMDALEVAVKCDLFTGGDLNMIEVDR